MEDILGRRSSEKKKRNSLGLSPILDRYIPNRNVHGSTHVKLKCPGEKMDFFPKLTPEKVKKCLSKKTPYDGILSTQLFSNLSEISMSPRRDRNLDALRSPIINQRKNHRTVQYNTNTNNNNNNTTTTTNNNNSNLERKSLRCPGDEMKKILSCSYPFDLHYGDLFSIMSINPRRKIPVTPFKILEAPQISDDFYLNLLHWGTSNVLCIGLGSEVYLWNAKTAQVTKLCNLGPNVYVCCVRWNSSGTILAVSANNGMVQLWDVGKGTLIKAFFDHKVRVGALSWNSSTLSSGSRDRSIICRDTRCDDSGIFARLNGHGQEVCGLSWAPDGAYLASGGNDNKVLIWRDPFYRGNRRDSDSKPLLIFDEHNAAVKALTWSPHKRGLLATGGGTADRCIRFWDVIGAQTVINVVDTGSQVCNLAWSNAVDEIVSSHGYSQNDIGIWSYPSLSRLCSLTGHSTRVLYMDISPDGRTVVTGAGDETIRFWNVFSSASTDSAFQKQSRTNFNRPRNDLTRVLSQMDLKGSSFDATSSCTHIR